MSITHCRRAILAIAAGVAVAALPSMTSAQTYPTKPIRFILGFPPGGGLDSFVRVLAPFMSEKLGQPITVENRTGANGNIATEFVAGAPADGHTVLFSTASAVVAAPNAGTPLNVHPVHGLAPVTIAAESPFMIITNPGLPAKTWADFAALMKKEPGKYIHASPGIGSSNHVGGELLALRSGVSFKTAQYRGSGPIMTDMLADQVHFTIASVGLAEPYLKSGRLGAMMVFGKERVPQLPNVPSSSELGIKDVDQISFWISMHAPKATPRSIIDKLNATLVEVYKNPALKEKMAAATLSPVGQSPEATLARFESDLKLYAEIFKAANIKMD